MTNARPGRGRPALFDTVLQDRYLDALRAGLYAGAAAEHVCVTRNVPSNLARTNPTFRHAVADAKAEGRKARIENVGHGEARYNNYGCRCPICTRAATAARAGRRTTDTEPGGEGGESGKILNLPPVVESPSLLLLRIAS